VRELELYDVYLKQRLTEIDVIITQLVQRDAFSMYDWLNIFATMDDIEIRKALKIESEMFIDVSMHDILKIVHEQIVSEMYLGTDVCRTFTRQCKVRHDDVCRRIRYIEI